MANRETSEFLYTAHAGLHMLCHAARDPVAVVSLPAGELIDVNRAFQRLLDVPEPLPPDLTLTRYAPIASVLRRWDGSRPRLISRITLGGIVGRARLLALPAVEPPQAFFHFMPRRSKRARPERLQALLDERLEQIRNYERLRSLGEIASVVVHELKTPLSSIRLAVETVRRAAGLDPSSQRRLDVAIEQTARLDRLLSSIRNFSRPHTLELRPLDVRSLVSSALQAVEGSLQGPATTVTVEVKPDPLPLMGDSDRLVEALQNVIVNAIESMPNGGTVAIIAAPGSRRGWIDIRVTDQGPGVAAAVQERLFQPFFTTKPAGTGLGLSIVRRIVELHGGFVSLQGAEGRGTTVLIELPSGA